MTRALIISHDVIDLRMAGPGIRNWELARVLAKHCAVTLAVPGQSALHDDRFVIQGYQLSDWRTVQPAASQADVILTTGLVVRELPQLTQVGCPLVIDMYDPYPAESMSMIGSRSPEEQATWHQHFIDQLRIDCASGDFFLCASERQRYWWLGILASYGRINAATYQADPSLRNLIDVVSFGLDPAPLQHGRQVLKGVVPGIGPNDKVLLWGGGIWEWLDPLTLLRALPQVISQRPDVKVVFPGTQHPNATVPAMPMKQRAIDLARELNLLNTHVFFGDWVAYANWSNYLSESDFGVSLHFDSLETQLALRSRVLDYIRAELPIIVSRGDAMSEIVKSYGLGVVVDYQDATCVARTILQLLDEPRDARAEQFAAAKAHLTWEVVAQPLVAFCLVPHEAADHQDNSVILQKLSETEAQAQLSQLRTQLEQQSVEAAHLQALVNGYEQGRFIRLMRQLHQWRTKANLNIYRRRKENDEITGTA